MRTEGDTWVCRSCENERLRDSQAEAAMATREGQRDDGAPAVADATRGSTETMQESCPAEECDSDRAYYEMLPKPGDPTGFGYPPVSSVATSGESPDTERARARPVTPHPEIFLTRQVAPVTDAADVLQRVDANDVELIRLVFVNNSGVPRGRVVDAESLPGVVAEGTNVTHAIQSFNALDRLAPEGRYGPAGEVRVVPDPESYTELPYADRAAIMLADLQDLDGEPWAAGPLAQLGE